MSSDTRIPVAYSSSIIARSRSPRGVVDVRLCDQRVDIVERQALRQRRPGARRTQVVGRILRQAFVDYQETEEAADGGDRARHRPRRQPRGHLLANERLEVPPVECLHRDADAGGELRQARRRSRP